MSANSGRLIGIARREIRGAPMLECAERAITTAAGLAGDCKGAKFARRQVTILEREAWDAALAQLGTRLPWTTRRANLLVEGIRLPRSAGGIVRIGAVLLEVTGQTYPCRRIDKECPGLLSALAPDWRGGVTARVLEGGTLAHGDPVEVLLMPATHERRLPG